MWLEIGFLSKVYADGNLNSKWMDTLDAWTLMVMLQAMFIFHAKASMAKILTNEVVQKIKVNPLPLKKFERTIMHGEKLRYSESIHFYYVVKKSKKKENYAMKFDNSYVYQNWDIAYFDNLNLFYWL